METGLKFDEVLHIQAFNQLKNCSHYQTRSLITLLFSMLQYSILIAGLPFFIRLPSINCLKDKKLQVCPESDVCTLKHKYIFEFSEFKSVVNEW